MKLNNAEINLLIFTMEMKFITYEMIRELFYKDKLRHFFVTKVSGLVKDDYLLKTKTSFLKSRIYVVSEKGTRAISNIIPYELRKNLYYRINEDPAVDKLKGMVDIDFRQIEHDYRLQKIRGKFFFNEEMRNKEYPIKYSIISERRILIDNIKDEKLPDMIINLKSKSGNKRIALEYEHTLKNDGRFDVTYNSYAGTKDMIPMNIYRDIRNKYRRTEYDLAVIICNDDKGDGRRVWNRACTIDRNLSNVVFLQWSVIDKYPASEFFSFFSNILDI